MLYLLFDGLRREWVGGVGLIVSLSRSGRTWAEDGSLLMSGTLHELGKMRDDMLNCMGAVVLFRFLHSPDAADVCGQHKLPARTPHKVNIQLQTTPHPPAAQRSLLAGQHQTIKPSASRVLPAPAHHLISVLGCQPQEFPPKMASRGGQQQQGEGGQSVSAPPQTPLRAPRALCSVKST